MKAKVPRRRKKKASVAGWTKWLPVVVLPVGVLFFETWLRTEQVKKDYRMAELIANTAAAKKQLNGLHAEIAAINPLDRLEKEAEKLGLAPPEPNQIQIIYHGSAPADPVPAEPSLLRPDLLTIKPEPPAPVEGPPAKEMPAWSIETESQRPKHLAAAMQHLRKAIAGAYATCFGHS